MEYTVLPNPCNGQDPRKRLTAPSRWGRQPADDQLVGYPLPIFPALTSNVVSIFGPRCDRGRFPPEEHMIISAAVPLMVRYHATVIPTSLVGELAGPGGEAGNCPLGGTDRKLVRPLSLDPR